MVVAIPSPTAATPIAAAASTVRAHKSPSPHHHCPLAPSEKDNAALSRKPHAKEISSRFLPSSSSSSSPSTSRCAPSPLPTSSSSGPKRSHSVDRSHHSAAAKGSGAAPPRLPGPSAPPPRASLSPSRESPSSRPARPSPPYLLPLPESPPLTADVSLELRREAITCRRTRNPLTTTSAGQWQEPSSRTFY